MSSHTNTKLPETTAININTYIGEILAHPTTKTVYTDEDKKPIDSTDHPGRPENQTSIIANSAKCFKFRRNPKNVGISGLYGCVSLIIVSSKGVYITHYLEDRSFRDFGDNPSPMSFEREVLTPLRHGAPTQVSLAQFKKKVGLGDEGASKIGAFIMAPSRYKQYSTWETNIEQIRAEVEHKFTGRVVVSVVEYDATLAQFQKRLDEGARGKALVQYVPRRERGCSAKQVRVWIEKRVVFDEVFETEAESLEDEEDSSGEELE